MLTTCYSREQLSAYLNGRIEEDLTELIEQHVEQCAACEDTLTELDRTDDSLIRTLQVKSSTGPGEIPAWVERIAEQPVEENASDVPHGADESPTHLGDYELQGIIGRGGMSIVFSARHRHLGREVALKVLLPTHQQHGLSRDRFSREMRAVGGLDHPAVVRAMDAGEYRNTLYLVMEKIDGIDLTRLSRRVGPLRVADACQIVAEAAQGLAYAHEKGIVHRDIKPSNLIVDEQGRVKILDFGLARIHSAVGEISLQTTVGQLVGTLDYMAPEQANGGEVDARADIYALGATLFKLLTGRPPHGRSADVPILEHLHRLATCDADSLDALRDGLPPALVQLVHSLLCRRPEERVSDAQEVARRLAEFASGADLRALRDATMSLGDDGHEQASQVSARESLKQIWGDQASDAPADGAFVSGASSSRNAVWSKWIVAALFGLAAVICLAVVIVIQTDKGEIRIESQVDDVRVGLVRDGRVVESLVVDQGKKAVRVRSGQYEIRIDSPSDGVEITPDKVVIIRGGVAIAAIKQSESIAGGQTQTDDAAKKLANLNLQLQIADAASQLAAARQKYGPQHPEVQQLAEKLSRLQAIQRPVPSEPVFEGRTLAEWHAQMRFEQKKDEKRYAALGVSELAHTRPGREGLSLALEAGGLLVRMRRESTTMQHWMDFVVFELLSSARRAMGEDTRHALEIPVERLREMPRAEADQVLAEMLASGNDWDRDYALVLLARLHSAPPEGDSGWPRSLTAVAELSNAQLKGLVVAVLAAGTRDPALAANILTRAPVEQATYQQLLCWFQVVHDRKLPVAHDVQTRWIGRFLVTAPSDTSWEQIWDPGLGPLQGVDWNAVTAEQQAALSQALRHLITALSEGSQKLAQDRQFEAEVSAWSYALCSILEFAHLQDPVRSEAVAALNQRLEHLLHLRDHSETLPEGVIDTPSQVAVAMTLLTGSAPVALERPPTGIGAKAKQLEALKELFQSRTVVESRSFTRENSPFSQAPFDWYPHQALAQFEQFETARVSFTRDGGGMSTSPIELFRRSSGRIAVHPVLTADYLADRADSRSNTAAGLSSLSRLLLRPTDLSAYLQRHPDFAQRIIQWSESAQHPELLDQAVEILLPSWTRPQYLDKLYVWLEGDDEVHASYALGKLQVEDRDRMFGERSREMALAIGRLAKRRGEFAPVEIYYLHQLGSRAEPAIDELVAFVVPRLGNPDSSLLSQVLVYNTRNRYQPITLACELLAQFPERMRPHRAEIESAAASFNDAVVADYYNALLKILKAIDGLRDE